MALTRHALAKQLPLAALLALLATGPRIAVAAADTSAADNARAARAMFDHEAAAQGPAGTVMVEPTRVVEARLGMTVEVPALVPTSWVAFATVPPTLSCQRPLSFSMTPQTMQVGDARDPSRRLIMAVLSAAPPPDVHKVTLGAVYHVELFKRTLLEGMRMSGKGAAPALTPVELQSSLGASETLDWATPEFQSQLSAGNLRARRGETELAFARRAFVSLRSLLLYDYQPSMDRRSSVVWKAGKSDCGGINGLLVSVLRANGIPARPLCGRWARTAEPGATLGGVPYLQWHVKAEMFLRDVGWIPLDLCGAVQTAKPGEDGLSFFGKDRGDFLVMHVGFDLLVDTLGAGHQNVMADQGFAYWVRGKGDIGGMTKHETWVVQDMPVLQAAR